MSEGTSGVHSLRSVGDGHAHRDARLPPGAVLLASRQVPVQVLTFSVPVVDPQVEAFVADRITKSDGCTAFNRPSIDSRLQPLRSVSSTQRRSRSEFMRRGLRDSRLRRPLFLCEARDE